MQALLSFDQSPPLAAPLRFFASAPLFAVAAGVLLLARGGDGLVSRWTPEVLALTHLIAAGFMLQVMLGALLQIMPVVAGANLRRPLRVASIVHALLTFGALSLAAAFLTYWPLLFQLATVCLGAGIAYFVVAAARALSGLASTSPTIGGLKYALAGLVVTVALGLLMSVALGWSLELPLVELANFHLGWGFMAWGSVLLAAVGSVVVPMFQLTPAYPDWFGRWYALVVTAVAVLWTIAGWFAAEVVVPLLGALLVALVALFCGVTLTLQRRSKRPRLDASQQLWRVALLSALAACALWAAAATLPGVEQWLAWPLVCGVLVLFGGFMSVMVGMLYKIVPFLIWLHLQNRGQGHLAAPNMKKIIAEPAIDRQALAHVASCLLLLLAACWPTVFVYPAGIALIVANAWLMRNLLSALAVYRAQLLKIEQAVGRAEAG